MAQTIKLTATDGTPVEFVDEVIGSGAMKDVYFGPDKSYVVGFFRTPQDAGFFHSKHAECEQRHLFPIHA